MSQLQTGEKELIKAYAVDSAGNGVTGLTVGVTVLKDNGLWYNGSNRTWSTVVYSNPMVESTARPAQYEFLFDPIDGGYKCSFLADVTGGTYAASVVNAPWGGDITVGGWIDYLDAPISESILVGKDALRKLGVNVISDDLRRQRGILDQILKRR